jgi:hypothetical protein
MAGLEGFNGLALVPSDERESIVIQGGDIVTTTDHRLPDIDSA